MVTDIFFDAIDYNTEMFDNGLNIEIHNCDGGNLVTIKLINDLEKVIISFSIRLNDFKKAFEILKILESDKK